MVIPLLLNTACGSESPQTQLKQATDEQSTLLAKSILPEVPQTQLDGQSGSAESSAVLTKSIGSEVPQTQPDGQTAESFVKLTESIGSEVPQTQPNGWPVDSAEYSAALASGLTRSPVGPAELSLSQFQTCVRSLMIS